MRAAGSRSALVWNVCQKFKSVWALAKSLTPKPTGSLIRSPWLRAAERVKFNGDAPPKSSFSSQYRPTRPTSRFFFNLMDKCAKRALVKNEMIYSVAAGRAGMKRQVTVQHLLYWVLGPGRECRRSSASGFALTTPTFRALLWNNARKWYARTFAEVSRWLFICVCGMCTGSHSLFASVNFVGSVSLSEVCHRAHQESFAAGC